jgi:phospholipid/cholesterol/gamma-HCH transport system substrate-binding protein
MSAKSSKFLIGLFVISGTLICAAIIIWVGAARILTKGSLYSVYFDESVQGLQADSAIKYRGVEIGKVQKIKVAPDNRLIEVVMKIDIESDLQEKTIATLKTAGITGIVFVELDQLKSGDLANSPKINFKSSYPVIPSRRSQISRFMADTDVIMQNVKDIDLKGISNQLKNTTKAIENFVDGKMDRVVNETMEVLSDAHQLIEQAKKDIAVLKLQEKADQTDTMLKDIDKKSKAITNALQDTSENLRVTSENLQKLSDNLTRNPSDLIFSKPAPPRKTME